MVRLARHRDSRRGKGGASRTRLGHGRPSPASSSTDAALDGVIRREESGGVWLSAGPQFPVHRPGRAANCRELREWTARKRGSQGWSRAEWFIFEATVGFGVGRAVVLGLDDDGAQLAELAFHGQHITDDGDVAPPGANSRYEFPESVKSRISHYIACPFRRCRNARNSIQSQKPLGRTAVASFPCILAGNVLLSPHNCGRYF